MSAVREAEREHGERLVEAFADARGSARIAVLETPGQVLQQAARRRDVGLLVGAGDDRPNPRTLSLRQMLEDVPELVDLMPTSA